MQGIDQVRLAVEMIRNVTVLVRILRQVCVEEDYGLFAESISWRKQPWRLKSGI